MATDFPYAQMPNRLPDLLDKIRVLGIPDIATNKWLEASGFKSSNDRKMLNVLKFVGFMDDSGKPTELWKRYRGKDHKVVLADGVREGYSELFRYYPNACIRSQEDLQNYFGTKTSSGMQVLSKMARTFLVLCSLSDFEAIETEEEISASVSDDVHEVVPRTTQPEAYPSTSRIVPPLHIDVQIHIASDATIEQIDQIFASMAKHLYRDEQNR